MKFRRRYSVVDAVQYLPPAKHEDVCFGRDPGRACYVRPPDLGPRDRYPHVHTNVGPIMVAPNDWILTHEDGSKYPCKPDDFAELWEPLTPATPWPGAAPNKRNDDECTCAVDATALCPIHHGYAR